MWPPFVGAGVSVSEFTRERAVVKHSSHFWNRTSFGAVFGGTIVAMVDPFAPLILSRSLGSGYRVWVSELQTQFVKVGRGDLIATVVVPAAVVEDVRAATADGEKHFCVISTDVCDRSGDVVATITQTLYVRRSSRDAS